MLRTCDRSRGGGGGGGSATPSFVDPSSIAGLQLWLDASDSATVLNTAGAVDTWVDKSGNVNNATAALGKRPVTGTRTINSKNALDFDGTNQGMLLPAGLNGIPSGPNTVFVVYQSDNAGDATQQLITGTTAGTAIRYECSFTATDIKVQNRTTSNSATTQALVRDTTARVIGFRRSGTSITPFISGVEGTAGTNSEDFTAAAMAIGTQTYATLAFRYNGLIAEIIIYNSSLSDTNMDNVGNYLNAKWGSSWTNLIPSAPASALTADDAGLEVYYADDALSEMYLTE